MFKLFKQIVGELPNFLVGFLLVPWVWVWGFYVIIFVTYLIGLGNGTFSNFYHFALTNDRINLNLIWLLVTAFLFGNYLIAYSTQYTYPRLKPLLFFVSLFTFLTFFAIYYPFLIEVISF